MTADGIHKVPYTLVQSGLKFLLTPSAYVDANGKVVIGQVPNASQTVTFSAVSGATVGGTIATTGNGGGFSYTTGSGLAVGDYIVVTGTLGGTGTITGYSTGTMYYVSAVGAGTFTLQTSAQGAIVTTAGTITGLTFTPYVGAVFSAATLAGTSAGDLGRQITVQQGSGPYTYISCGITVYVSNAAAACTLSGTLSGVGPYTPWLTGPVYTATNAAGANSQTYSAPLNASYANLFAYLPASSAVGTAGSYPCTMAAPSLSVLTCYNNAYAGGNPVLGNTAFSGLTPAAFTQTTNGPITMLSSSLAGNSLGQNGAIKAECDGLNNNSAGSKSLSAWYGGVIFASSSNFTTTTSFSFNASLRNQGATGAQTAHTTVLAGATNIAILPSDIAVDSSQSQTLALRENIVSASTDWIWFECSANVSPN